MSVSARSHRADRDAPNESSVAQMSRAMARAVFLSSRVSSESDTSTGGAAAPSVGRRYSRGARRVVQLSIILLCGAERGLLFH